tara:strand:+ start:808 stop:1803 length:996 start_codon:yes stop_codon:yes gene_type:complete
MTKNKLCYIFSINADFYPTIWEGQIALFNMIYSANIKPENICCVIYNNNAMIQHELVQHIPPSVNIIYGNDYSKENIWRIYDRHYVHKDTYTVLNKSSSIGEFYKAGLHEKFENLFLFDADSFFYDEVDYSSYFGRTVLGYAQFIRMSNMFKEEYGVIEKDVWSQQYQGIDLKILFKALNIPQYCIDLLIEGGTHHLFMPTHLITEKFINDLNNWSIACKTLCKIQGWTNTWIPDMVTYALSLASNNVPFEALNNKEVSYSSLLQHGIVHYGFAYPFHGSPQFTKGMYYDSNKSPMKEKTDDIVLKIHNSRTEVEKYFFELVKKSKEFYKI